MSKSFRKKIVVIGCSSIGAKIAAYMCENGSSVMVVDREKKSFKRLSHTFSGHLFEGDATNLNTLNELGISDFDIAVVATENDNVNSMIAQICKAVIGIESVIARMDGNDADEILKKQDIKIIHTSDLGLEIFLNFEIRV